MEMPDADSAVPQSPVSGNTPSARGLPLVGSGTGSTTGSRSCPQVLYFPWPARRPARPAPYVSTSHECPPGENSHSPSTSVPTPFLLVYAALLAVAPLVMGPGRLPLGQGLDFEQGPTISEVPGRVLAPNSFKRLPCSASARVRAVPRWAPIIPPWNRWSRLPRRSAGTTSWGLHPCPFNSWNWRWSTPLTKYRRSHWRHSTLVSRDSGEMSSQRGRSFPTRFHLMMGPMSGSASCRAAIWSGVQPGSHS